MLIDLMDYADVGMVESCGRLSFLNESLLGFFVLRELRWEEFKGHDPPKFRVLSFIDDSHPAAADLFDDLVLFGNDFLDRRVGSLHRFRYGGMGGGFETNPAFPAEFGIRGILGAALGACHGIYLKPYFLSTA